MTSYPRAVQDAVASLRERALLEDGALFSDDSVWNMVNLRALWVALTKQRADLRRLESLGEQLSGLEEEVVRLAAELIWLIYLFAGPGCISHSRKSELVRTIYEWSGHTLLPSHPLLGDMGLPPHGGLGLLYSARLASELKFLIKALVGIKKRSVSERRALLSDPWATARMLDEAAGSDPAQFSLVFRHLLFPRDFDAIFSGRDKRRIIETFSGIPRKETRRWDITRLDVELASIRTQLQELNEGSPLSFLSEPLVSSWRQGTSQGAVTTSEQRFWVEKRVKQDHVVGALSPECLGSALWVPHQATEEDDAAVVLREVEPGDVIFHLIENEGIVGVSLVAGELEEDCARPDDTPEAGAAGYRVQLEEFTEVTPMLNQSALLSGSKFQDRLRRLAEIHRSLFFNRQLTLNRGGYLSEAPEALVQIFDEAYHQNSNRHLPHVLLPAQENLPVATVDEHTSYPIAQIITGASGTGKTHTAMARAVEICDGAVQGTQEQLRARYEQLQEEARIRLVTFHPSFSYGDFMERRAYAPQQLDDAVATTEAVVRPGIFKQMAIQAGADQPSQAQEVNFDGATVWKLTPQPEDDEAVYRNMLENGLLFCAVPVRVDFSGCNERRAVVARLAEKTGQAPDEDVVSTIDLLVNRMGIGDFVILVDNDAACRGIGRISGGYRPKASAGKATYAQCRSVDWIFVPDEPLAWSRITRKQFLPRMLYQLDLSLLNLTELSSLLELTEPATRNYVLIIDEIGRGNVREIFGELVTLIEQDKRAGAASAVTVTLPLSGEQFSVPGNLYLIGTLNSADRLNPEQADILYRRFQLDELSPDESLIRGDDQLGTIPDGEGGRIDLRALMLAINRRLEILLDRDHRLGHAYFMGIQSYEELVAVIRTRIIPCLKNLLDNDWRRIQLVLNDLRRDGEPNSPQLISHEDLCGESGSGWDLEPDLPKVRFWVTPEYDLHPDAFRKIYSDPR